MMVFREIQIALIDKILGPQATDKFRVIGYQDQGRSSKSVLDNNRLVQVYYKSGDFEKKGGSISSKNMHDMTFNIEMTVSADAKADLSVLNNENASQAVTAAAIDSFVTASQRADDLIDELIDIIWNILADARNADLGQEKGVVANRWIGGITKGDPANRGEHVTLMAQMRLTCRASEVVKGITPKPLTFIDNSITINEDNNSNTGVKIQGA